MSLWNEAFLWRALAAALMMAIVASPIGCLMIWRKTAYFSDALSHAALTGILLGISLGFSPNLGVTAVVCALAFTLYRLPANFVIGSDLFLLITGQTALCVGVIGLSSMTDVRTDLLAYLFGDVLSVTGEDLLFIGFVSAVCMTLLAFNWKKQVFLTVVPDVAESEGVSNPKQSAVFMLLIALFVSLAMKTTGLLLVSSLLIIPPATARFLSKTPEEMAAFGSIIGAISVVAGLFLSVMFDWPTAPTVVVFCAVMFAVVCLVFLRHKNAI